MNDAQPLLSLKQLQCRHGENLVVHDLSLDVARGELISLLGYSGCGKTTVLRAIAGLEPLYGGSILFENNLYSSPSVHLPPERRNFGMVFQDYALFPHLNVEENITFSCQRLSRKARQRLTAELLELVNLEGLQQRHPHELSGGQQQRVALARALAQSPDLILLDEPFSSLDVELRTQLADDVRLLLKSRGITAVVVTHDQTEAFALADRIAVMHDGTIQQWDTPYNLYHRPDNRFVAEFIGQGVIIPGKVIGDDAVETELGVIRGTIYPPRDHHSPVDLLLRPDDLVYDPQGEAQGLITQRNFLGAEYLYTLTLPSGNELLALCPSHLQFPLGERLRFNLELDNLILFERSV